MDRNWGHPPYYGHPTQPGQSSSAPPGGTSVLGVLSKVNKGILKNPTSQTPSPGPGTTVPAISQQMPGFTAQPEPKVKPQHEAFMLAKSKIEMIQKGLWKGDRREPKPGMSSDPFKVPQLPTQHSKAGQGAAPGVMKPAAPLVEYEEDDGPDNSEDDRQRAFSRQKALEEIDRYRSVARADRERASRVPPADNRGGAYREPAENKRGSYREPTEDVRGSYREPTEDIRGSYREPAEDKRGSYREPVRDRDRAYREIAETKGNYRESESRYERDYDKRYDKESTRGYDRVESTETYKEATEDDEYDVYRVDRYTSGGVDSGKHDHESRDHNTDTNRKAGADGRFRDQEKDYNQYSPAEVESRLANKSRSQEFEKSSHSAESRDRYRDTSKDTDRNQSYRRVDTESASRSRQEQKDDRNGSTAFEVFDYGHQSESDKAANAKDTNLSGVTAFSSTEENAVNPGRFGETDRDMRDRDRSSDSYMDRDYSRRRYEGDRDDKDLFGNRPRESEYQKGQFEDYRETRESYGDQVSGDSAIPDLKNRPNLGVDRSRGGYLQGQDRDERIQNQSQSKGSFTPNQSESRSYTQTQSRDGFSQNQTRDGFSQNQPRDGFSQNQSRDGYSQNQSRGGYSGSQTRGEHLDDTRDSYYDARKDQYGQDYRDSASSSNYGYSDTQQTDTQDVIRSGDIYPVDARRVINVGNERRFEGYDKGNEIEQDTDFRKRQNSGDMLYEDFIFGEGDEDKPVSKDSPQMQEVKSRRSTEGSYVDKDSRRVEEDRNRRSTGDRKDGNESRKYEEDKNKLSASNVNKDSRKSEDDRYRRSDNSSFRKDSRKSADDRNRTPNDFESSHTRKNTDNSRVSDESKKRAEDRNRDTRSSKDSKSREEDRKREERTEFIPRNCPKSGDRKRGYAEESNSRNQSPSRKNTESSLGTGESKRCAEDRNRDTRSSKDSKSREEDRDRKRRYAEGTDSGSRSPSSRARREERDGKGENRPRRPDDEYGRTGGDMGRERAMGRDRDMGRDSDMGRERDVGHNSGMGRDIDMGLDSGMGRERDKGPDIDMGRDSGMGRDRDKGPDSDMGRDSGMGRERDMGRDSGMGLDSDMGRERDMGQQEIPIGFRQTRWNVTHPPSSGATLYEDGQLVVGDVIQPVAFEPVTPANFGMAKPVLGPGILCKDCNIACLDTEVYEIHLQSDSHLLVLQKKAQELFQMAGASNNSGRFSPGEPFSMAPVIGPATPPPMAPVIPPKPKGPLQFTSIGCSSLKMSWARLTGADREAVEKYMVEYRNARETEWITVGTTDRYDYTVTDLEDNTDYLFRVYAVNGEEKGDVLESVLITTRRRKEKAVSPVRKPPPSRKEPGRGVRVSPQREVCRARGRNVFDGREAAGIGMRSHLDRNRDRFPKTSQDKDKKSSQDGKKDRDKDRKSNQDKDKDKSQKSSKEKEKDKPSQKQRSDSRDKSADCKSDKKKEEAKSDQKKKDDKSSTGKDKPKESPDKKDDSNSRWGKKGDEKEAEEKEGDNKGSNGGDAKKVDGEKKEDVVEIAEDVECLLYREIPKMEEQPLLGLEYLWEIVSYKPTVPVRYLCKLCNTKGFSSPAMIKHVTGVPHKMEFFKKFNQRINHEGRRVEVQKKFNMTTYDTISMITPRKDQLERINHEGRLVEDRLGRGAVKVMLMLNPQDTDGKVKFKDPVEVKAPPPVRGKTTTEEAAPDSTMTKSQFRKIFDETVEKHELEDIALIGMSYLKEFIHPTDEKEKSRYTCSLCTMVLTDATVIFHMIGKKHRLAYMKVHYPDFWTVTTKCPEGKLLVINKAKEIEATKGSGEFKCLVARNARLWRPNLKAKDAFAEDEEEAAREGDGPRPVCEVTMATMAAEEKEENGGIKFGIRKSDPASKQVKAVNVLEEAKPKSKEAFDWTKENATLQAKIQNQTIIKSSRKSKFITVYREFFKRYPVIGLQWVTEFQKPDPKMEPWYMCFMCQQKLQWKSILDHVTSSTHRINYMKKNYETKYQSLLNTINTNKTRGRAVIESYSREIMQQENPVSTMEVMLELNINKEALKSVMKVKDHQKSTASSMSSVQTSTITTTSALSTTLVTTSSTATQPMSSDTPASLVGPGLQTLPPMIQQPAPQPTPAHLVAPQVAAAVTMVTQSGTPQPLLSKTVYPYMPPQPSHPAVFSTMSVASRQMPGVNNNQVNPANRYSAPGLNANVMPPGQVPNQPSFGQGLQGTPGQPQNMYPSATVFSQQQMGGPVVATPTVAPQFRSQPPWQRANTPTYQPPVNVPQTASLNYQTGLQNTSQTGTLPNQIIPSQTGLQQQMQTGTGNFQTGLQTTSQTGSQPSQLIPSQTVQHQQQQQMPTGSQAVSQTGTDSIQKVVEKQAEKVLTKQILQTGQFPPPGTTKVSLESDNSYKSKLFAKSKNQNQTGEQSQRGEKRLNWSNEQKGAFGDFKRPRMAGRGWQGERRGGRSFGRPGDRSGIPYNRGRAQQDFNRERNRGNFSDQTGRQDNWDDRFVGDFDDEGRDMRRESEERYDEFDDQGGGRGRDMYDDSTSGADDYNMPLSSRELEDLVQMYDDRTGEDARGEFDLDEDYRHSSNPDEYLDEHFDDFADQQSHQNVHPNTLVDEGVSFRRRRLDNRERFDQRDDEYGDEFGRGRFETDERGEQEYQEDFEGGGDYRDNYNDEGRGNLDEVDREVDQFIDDRQEKEMIDSRDDSDRRGNRGSARGENRHSSSKSRRERSDERDFGQRNRNRDESDRRKRPGDLRDRSPRSDSRSDNRSGRSRSNERDRDRSRRDRSARSDLERRSRSRHDRSARETDRGSRTEETRSSRSGRSRKDGSERRSRSSRISGGDRDNSRSESPFQTPEGHERWSREPEDCVEDPSREEIDMLLRKVNTSLMKMPEEIRQSIRTDVAREMPRVIDKLDQVFPSGGDYEEQEHLGQSGGPLVGRNQGGARGGRGSRGMFHGSDDFDVVDRNRDNIPTGMMGRLGPDSQTRGNSRMFSNSRNFSMADQSLAASGSQINVSAGGGMGGGGLPFSGAGVGGIGGGGISTGAVGFGVMAGGGGMVSGAGGGIGGGGMGGGIVGGGMGVGIGVGGIGGGIGTGGMGAVGGGMGGVGMQRGGMGNEGIGGGNMGGGSFRGGAIGGRGFRGRGVGGRGGYRGGRGGYSGTR